MDLANSVGPGSTQYDVVPEEDSYSDNVNVGLETNCWGCGLRVLVASYARVFKCGWCGALTRKNDIKIGNNDLRWRRLRDRCFVFIVILFMLFFICGGVWAVYPVMFSISYLCGIFHSVLTAMLSVSTLSSFSLAAFRPAGASPAISWGSYPTVEKDGLQNYTFCQYCLKPKSPRTHHCRSCGTCVLDMDHHCPFIGNCVGAANHRWFVLFLTSTVCSTVYVAVMTSYSASYVWPPLDIRARWFVESGWVGLGIVREIVLSILRSAVFLPIRGLVLVYLFVASVSVGIGLSVLLWQQLSYIYAGKTYLDHLSSVDSEEMAERDCRNLVRFFGCSCHGPTLYLPSYWKSRKRHKT
ncbi:protein S-acyltransferase 11 [Andrographis paniculata]|uniref:protein S-acyltransferase 11 n=1 Tax=Andrographis paniculata TaxID=175694 RepID=UPI0021E6F55A|nr:protein S-acyltransferase 11 [Andrographis paniculata]